MNIWERKISSQNKEIAALKRKLAVAERTVTNIEMYSSKYFKGGFADYHPGFSFSFNIYSNDRGCCISYEGMRNIFRIAAVNAEKEIPK